jgi:hypothetical protein
MDPSLSGVLAALFNLDDIKSGILLAIIGVPTALVVLAYLCEVVVKWATAIEYAARIATRAKQMALRVREWLKR